MNIRSQLLPLFGLIYIVVGASIFLGPKLFHEWIGYQYGPFSAHFIQDAGLAFVTSGSLLFISLFFPKELRTLQWSGLLFLNLHACFHLYLLLYHLSRHSVGFELGFNILPPISLSIFLYQSGDGNETIV